MKKTLQITLLLLVINLSNGFAQEFDLPKTTQNGKEFYLYTVKEKEGLYRISKTFNVSQEEILTYNQQAVAGINPGMQLKIPVVEGKNKAEKKTETEIKPAETNENSSIHKVEAGETLYAISRKYNLKVSELEDLNPEVKDGLKVGMELKLPKQKSNSQTEKVKEKTETTNTNTYSNTKPHIVAPKETLYSLSKLYNVSTNDLIKYNPELAYGLQIGKTIQIPTNESLKKEEKIATENKPNISNAILPSNTVKVALLLPFMLDSPDKQDATINKFIEFYEGTLLALENLKKSGVSVQLTTLDIEKSDVKAKEVLQSNLAALRKMDLIIGPAYSAQVNVVTNFCKVNSIPLVVPFSPNVEAIETNPYVFQNNASRQKKFTEASKLFIKNFAGKNIVIINFNNDTEDEGSEFVKFLKINFKRQNIAFKEMAFTVENYANIQSMLTAGSDNILVFGTDKPNIVKDLLPKLNPLNTPTTTISVFGFADWGKALKNYRSTYYYTPFYIDRKNKSTGLYRQKYMQEFGVPNTSSMPRFDLMGYDLAHYFIKAIALYGKSFYEKLPQYEQTQVLQSRFKFEKQNQGGYINAGVRLIRYTEEKDTEVIE